MVLADVLLSLVIEQMAATAAALEDSATATDNWPQDEQSVGPVGNEQATNGALSAVVEERSTGQDTEQQDPIRSSSVGAVETFRERQVKVLRSFLSVFGCSFEARPLGLAFSCWARD